LLDSDIERKQEGYMTFDCERIMKISPLFLITAAEAYDDIDEKLNLLGCDLQKVLSLSDSHTSMYKT